LYFKSNTSCLIFKEKQRRGKNGNPKDKMEKNKEGKRESG
jgi:hypothetical protein